jgi:hypothetical protein
MCDHRRATFMSRASGQVRVTVTSDMGGTTMLGLQKKIDPATCCTSARFIVWRRNSTRVSSAAGLGFR